MNTTTTVLFVLCITMEQFQNSKGVGLIQASNYTKNPIFNNTPSKTTNIETSEIIKEQKWNIFDENVTFPSACLSSSKLNSNIEWMEKYISQYPSIQLAPHGKTTMCPKLFLKQAQSPSTWGITLATAQQVQVAANFGIKKLLLANQLVGKTNMELISSIMKFDDSIEFICLVDSTQNLRQLGTHFKAQNLQLQILIEVGVLENGRTGIRSEAELKEIIDEIENHWSDVIKLVGIEFYEGILPSTESVTEFIQSQVATMWNACFSFKNIPFHTKNNEIIISGAGSKYFDVVAEELSKFKIPTTTITTTSASSSAHDESESEIDYKIKILLRPGCYVVQDIGDYQEAQNRMQSSNQTIISKMATIPPLAPALQIWAYVTSKPQPGLIILGLGRRDISFDAGLPKPSLLFHPNDTSSDNKIIIDKKSTLKNITGKNWILTKIMDQHAFMEIQAPAAASDEDSKDEDFEEISIGDMIAFDIKHPCTTFDKWRAILLIDDDYNVIDVLETYF